MNEPMSAERLAEIRAGAEWIMRPENYSDPDDVDWATDVLAVFAEVDRLAKERDQLDALADSWMRQASSHDAALARVRVLHVSRLWHWSDGARQDVRCGDLVCRECRDAWPCATSRAAGETQEVEQ